MLSPMLRIGVPHKMMDKTIQTRFCVRMCQIVGKIFFFYLLLMEIPQLG